MCLPCNVQHILIGAFKSKQITPVTYIITCQILLPAKALYFQQEAPGQLRLPIKVMSRRLIKLVFLIYRYSQMQEIYS